MPTKILVTSICALLICAFAFMGFNSSDTQSETAAENVAAESGKIIVFIRHAKSSKEYDFLRDFDRPLNAKGIKDALKMGESLKSRGMIPDLIIASPAVRTYTTAAMIADKVDYLPGDINLEQSIYRAPKEKYLEALANVDDKHRVVFIVAHNPATTQLGTALSDTTINDAKTGSCTAISFTEYSWKKVVKSKGKLLFYDYPALHKQQ